jgi:hypothetical protein
MATFLFRCTKTGLRVQGWVADEPRQPEKPSYEAVTCPACAGVHFVNSASGKTINEATIIETNGLKRVMLPGRGGALDHQ